VDKAEKSSSQPASGGTGFVRPVLGILLAGLSLLAFLGLSTYRPHAAVENWAGPVGHKLAGILLGFAGMGAYALALFVSLVGAALLVGRRVSFARTLAWLCFAASAMTLVALLVHARVQGHPPGGLLGALAAGTLRGALATAGAAVLLTAVALAALTVATDLWALRAAAAAGKLGIAGGALAFRSAALAVNAVRGRETDDRDGVRDRADDGVRDRESDREDREDRYTLGGDLDEGRADAPLLQREKGSKKSSSERDEEIWFRPAAFALDSASEPALDPRLPVAVPAASVLAGAGGAAGSVPTIVEPRKFAQTRPDASAKSRADGADAKGLKPAAGKDKDANKSEGPAREFTMLGGHSVFTPPPIDILTGEASAAAPLDRDGLTATAEKLRQKLASFGIQGQVTQIRPGPVVTMFEFLPAAGVKVSRIASLSDDLAMAMEALRVRIVAPIPGKGVVGIEVPNKQRQSVVLKELVEQEAFQKSPSKLAMCLGKDIEGMPYIADLARMPHLLIAGTTGSGKSVAVNSMIISMLLRASPEEVRFLMVDPKMLELSVYEGIPHLLLPVVTDSKKAAMALRWAVEEMERRYQLLADCGVRNIGSYNKKVEKDGDFARKKQKQVGKEKRVVDLTDPTLDVHELQRLAANGELTAVRAQVGLRPTPPGDAALTRGAAANGAGATAQSGAEWLLAEMQARGEPVELAGKQAELPLEPLRKLPYLVIIIDELADLMMVASREVETYIARLAQMARAAGIHLMVATQRPSTDVVTGVIKANFPARISFQVASRHDSATIINTPGAENLLGMGDMLILPPGTNALTRVHGPYVDEKEIHAVVEHWKAQGSPVYDPNILKPRLEDGEGEGGLPDEGPDELYDQAIASLGEMRFISISLLQRKLRVGYNRAARMIERMEKDGIVGPADGAKPREVLIRALGEMPGAGT
jgi:S-DNA-T family DNA segregation ATPase FtsK/SpoIIIE